MKLLKFMLFAAVLLFSTQPVLSDEHEIRKDKTLKMCWLENSDGEIVKIGSFCAGGVDQCAPNGC